MHGYFTDGMVLVHKQGDMGEIWGRDGVPDRFVAMYLVARE